MDVPPVSVPRRVLSAAAALQKAGYDVRLVDDYVSTSSLMGVRTGSCPRSKEALMCRFVFCFSVPLLVILRDGGKTWE